MLRSTVAFLIVASVCFARASSAQITTSAGYTPPDDTPSIKVGVTIYSDFTYQSSPDATDADGNTINPSSFNVSRAYINITGNINHIVAFRVTPDVVRESGLLTLGPGTTVSNDSLVYRIKYAYMQVNLDDWMTKGSWARFGIQQTPLLDFEESIYRYRFQGTTFTEREGFYNSADAGAGFHWNIPANYGDVHVGVYDGEGYARTDPNDDKAIEIRGTVRPFAAGAPILRGLRVTGFYFGDHYIRDAERTRAVGEVTFESKYLNTGFDAIKAHDQPSVRVADVEASGWSWWATPKLPFESTASVEALLRYDHLQPSTAVPANRTRTIVGVAWWFRNQGATQAALLLDYDGQTFQDFTTGQPAQKRIAVHGLINF
jgi:hypothetical protein